MKISVIIPTYNRANILKTTLSSFEYLKFDKKCYEIIVVDNNSKDNTNGIVKKFVDKLQIEYIFEVKQGKNHALNSAIKVARGNILVFTDDDVLVDENWLDEVYLSSLKYPDSDVFGGKILPKFPIGTPEWMKTSEYSAFVYAIHDPAQSEGQYLNEGTPGGPNCWIRKRLFDAGHMYDVGIGPKGYGRVSGSELEFFTRLRNNGIIPIYVPTAVVTHQIQIFQTKIRYLIKRSYSSGRGFVYIKGVDGCPRIFGIPRYLIRQSVEYLIKAICCYVKFDIKSAFEHVMIVSHRLGCIKQSLINCRIVTK